MEAGFPLVAKSESLQPEEKMIIGGSVAEVRQRLNELGDRVTRNEQDEWRVVGSSVQKLDLSPLSAYEIEERDELENTVSQAFYVAGMALKVLRDKKLYRETHRTFESYVKERFGFTKAAAYYLISAFEVVNNLKSQQIVIYFYLGAYNHWLTFCQLMNVNVER